MVLAGFYTVSWMLQIVSFESLRFSPPLFQPLDLLPGLFWFLFLPVSASLFWLKPHTFPCPTFPNPSPASFFNQSILLFFIHVLYMCVHAQT